MMDTFEHLLTEAMLFFGAGELSFEQNVAAHPFGRNRKTAICCELCSLNTGFNGFASGDIGITHHEIVEFEARSRMCLDYTTLGTRPKNGG